LFTFSALYRIKFRDLLRFLYRPDQINKLGSGQAAQNALFLRRSTRGTPRQFSGKFDPGARIEDTISSPHGPDLAKYLLLSFRILVFEISLWIYGMDDYTLYPMIRP